MRSLSRVELISLVGPAVVLVLMMTAYASFYGMWSLQKHAAFHTPAFDIGIFSQGVWLLSRFEDPFVTMLGVNLFGDNLSFILAAFVPFYWVWPKPEILLVLQAIALAVAAVPIYLLGRGVLKSRWVALVPVLAYLLYPALGWLNLENFHPDSLEVPLVLFAILFVLRGRWRWYWVMVVLLLLVKGDVWLFVVPLGIYVAVRHNRKMGLLTAGIGLTWFVVSFFLIQPALSGVPPGGLDAWRWPFGGFGGLVKTAFLSPWEVISYMFTSEKLMYLFQLLTPLLFLPLLTWRSLMVIPVLSFHMISNFWYQTNIHYHYQSLIIPILCVAAILSLERFRRISVRWALVSLLLLATFFSAYLWGPLPGSRSPGSNPDPNHPGNVAAREMLTLIPADAAVSAEHQFAAHLSQRRVIYVWPNPYVGKYYGDDSMKGKRLPGAEEVEYVVVRPVYFADESAQIYADLLEEGFEPIYDKQDLVLLYREAEKDGGESP